jgi:SAM-dependent methyltransferase
MDDLASFNQSRWDELARRGVLFARPLLDLTPMTARQWLDPYGSLGDVGGQKVLCLASGGGMQSAAFSVLGAHVTVHDLSPVMLERDRQAAEHYGYAVELHQGDMRDLSPYPDSYFDLVWHPYSINFIPDPQPVFRQVARLLKPGGHYSLQIHNPFVQGLDETSWTGAGYLLSLPYTNGAEMVEPLWEFEDEQGRPVTLPGPRAFRHTLSAVINGLTALGFNLRGLWEEVGQDAQAEPGSWEHYMRVAPPWLTLWLSH